MDGVFGKIGRIGRRAHAPSRDTVAYAKLQHILSGWNWGGNGRPLAKATPANLRRFSKSVYARRGIRVIKDTIATKAFEVCPKDRVEGSAELDRQIALVTACFNRPNSDDSWRSFLEQLIEDICVCGAGAFEHRLGGDQARPLWMWPVDALTIQIDPSWTDRSKGARYFQSLGYGNIGTQQGIPLRNDELTYIKSDPTTENPFGLGWIEVAFNTINRILSVADYAGNVAGNAIPANLLMFKGASDENIGSVREFWQNDVEGQGKTPIFGYEDIKAIPLRGNDDRSLFLAYQELLVRELAAASGLSPMNFAIERDVNRDTAEVSEDRDYRQTIVPTATLVTSYINREVIEGQLGFSQIRVKINGLDREDELDAAKVCQYRWNTNSITSDEIRKRYGEPQMEGEWGGKTKADVDIAISAARGSKVIEDADFPPQSEPEPNEPAHQTRRNRKEKS